MHGPCPSLYVFISVHGHGHPGRPSLKVYMLPVHTAPGRRLECAHQARSRIETGIVEHRAGCTRSPVVNLVIKSGQKSAYRAVFRAKWSKWMKKCALHTFSSISTILASTSPIQGHFSKKRDFTERFRGSK